MESKNPRTGYLSAAAFHLSTGGQGQLARAGIISSFFISQQFLQKQSGRYASRGNNIFLLRPLCASTALVAEAAENSYCNRL
jgi:hypothetical protein